MIKLYVLRQFAAFAEAGTLSEAAEVLHLSQPALSRNMKKLEEDLGVILFERKKNKLELNQNGFYVLDLTRTLLENADALAKKAQDFDRKNRTIRLGICAPALLWTVTPFISQVYPYLPLQTELESEELLLKHLMDDSYQLIALHESPDGAEFFCKKCGTESLMFALPKDHKYAKRKSLTFAEMNGENMLLMPDIGFWTFVMDKMPNSHFLTQSDRFSFDELVQASSLPSFITNLSGKYRGMPPSRIYIPISDAEATVSYYLVCKKNREKEFDELFRLL